MNKLNVIAISILIFAGLSTLVFAIPNPAPIYCKNMGYTSNGTHCIFDDGNVCEEWDFYYGNCGQEYVKELPCKEAGGSLEPGYECCEGLTSIGVKVSKTKTDGVCGMIAGAWSICAPCGNGVCDKDYENECNCPEDCSTACRDQNYECTTDDIPCCSGLKEVLLTYEDKGGECFAPVPCGSICIPCGDGICEDTRLENRCNCPEDCKVCPQWTPPSNDWCKDGEIIPGYTDKNGCQGPPKCVLPTAQKKPIKVEISTSEGITNISIEKIEEDIVLIKEGKTSIKTSKKLLIQERKLLMETSQGDKEIKMMPSEASEIAINQLKLKDYEIELKDVGKPVYEVVGNKEVKLIGLFRIKMKIKSQIDTETGDIEEIEKPWWSFLVK